MIHSSFILFCVIFGAGFELAESTSIVICPNQEKAVELLGTFNITANAAPFTKHVRSGRLPWVGLYTELISCVIIIDTTFDVSPGVVEVIGGGLNQRFIEVKVTSQVGKRIAYTMEAYSEGSNLAQTKFPRIN